MAEAFGLMQDLMAYSKDNPALSLNQSMTAYVTNMQQQIAQMPQSTPANLMLLQQMQQGANRMMNGPVLGQQMTMSPAMQAGLLPGNTMNGSPRVASGGN